MSYFPSGHLTLHLIEHHNTRHRNGDHCMHNIIEERKSTEYSFATFYQEQLMTVVSKLRQKGVDDNDDGDTFRSNNAVNVIHACLTLVAQ